MNSKPALSIRSGGVETHHMCITFHRTLRLPEDGKTYPLPPSLGTFPVKRIDDYADRVPASWREKGGVFLPMYQREAMWIKFDKLTHAPCAVKVGVGKVNAVSGERWKPWLDQKQQDYLVCPPQRWLDGVKTAEGRISQFVAMPLGMGYSVEGQVTGEEVHGGLQLAVYPGLRKHFPKPKRRKGGGSRGIEICTTTCNAGGQSLGWMEYEIMNHSEGPSSCLDNHVEFACSTQPPRTRHFVMAASTGPTVKAAAMGLAAGGRMEQKIEVDPYGVHVWNQEHKQRVFVHLVNSAMYKEITGENPPESPITRQTYEARGYPWFSVWDADSKDVVVSPTLAGVKTVSQIDKDKGFEGQQDDTSVKISTVICTGTPEVIPAKNAVRDGNW